jgi:hypothetical protein
VPQAKWREPAHGGCASKLLCYNKINNSVGDCLMAFGQSLTHRLFLAAAASGVLLLLLRWALA